MSIGFEFKRIDVISADFYLADLLSQENKTLTEKLSVLLKQDYYKLKVKQNNYILGNLYKDIYFKDNQQAHTEFWNLYQRPPKQE